MMKSKHSEYQKRIDALIPAADAEARIAAGKLEPGIFDRWAHRYNVAFHRHMDAAARAAGLRRQSWQHEGLEK